jgi:predicted DNA-binding ribbon-helix-helix protein
MSGSIVKRSVSIAGHRTSVSLEAPFWDALRGIANARARSVQSLIGEIDAGRDGQNLSSAIRVFVRRSMQERPGLPSTGTEPVAPVPRTSGETPL